MLLASIATRGDETVIAPAGWSLVRSNASGTALRQSVYVKTAGGSEGANYTWTFDDPVSTAIGGILAV